MQRPVFMTRSIVGADAKVSLQGTPKSLSAMALVLVPEKSERQKDPTGHILDISVLDAP